MVSNLKIMYLFYYIYFLINYLIIAIMKNPCNVLGEKLNNNNIEVCQSSSPSRNTIHVFKIVSCWSS